MGFSDNRIGQLIDKEESQIQLLRKKYKIAPGTSFLDIEKCSGW